MQASWRTDAAVGAAGKSAAAAAAAPQRPVLLPQAVYPDWEAIYTDNVGRIYRLMFAKVGNRPDAEDLTSQVFLAAYGPLRATAGVGEVRGYLTATARTVLAEYWRRTLGHHVTSIDPLTTDLEDYAGGRRDPVGLGEDDGSDDGRDDDGDGGGRGEGGGGRSGRARSEGRARDRVTRILKALPERHRRILVLRFLRGYTVKQAAAEMGITVGNAKVLQHRALRAAAGLGDEAEAGGEREGEHR